MQYYYRIIGEFPNGNLAYDFNVLSLKELRREHKAISHAHCYYIYKYSKGKLKERVYEKRWGKVYIDKKTLDKN